MTAGATPPASAPAPAAGLPPAKLGFADALFLAIENPVLRRELLAALRSNKAFVLHFIFLFVLGAVVYLAWPLEEIATRSERARQLFRIFGMGQLVMLSVLAPAFSASAMTIEKERRTLDLILTSPVRRHTIILGKYLSAVLYLLLLVLSTAPLVSVCVWLPGIDPYEVAGLYVLLASVAACFGMIGLACSIFLDRTQSALGVTYLAVLPLAGLLLLFAYIFDPFFVLAVALWPAGVLLLATIVLYQACLKRLREPFDPVYRAADDEEAADQTGLVLTRDRFPDNLLAPARNPEPLADGGNPVYQKELRCEIFGRGTLFLRLVIQVSLFLSVVFLPFLFLGWEYVLVDYLVVFTMLVAPAFACNAFTQERERGTLDLLLTSLVTPRQIVNGKFLACLRLSFFLCGLASVTLLFYLLVGGAGDRSHARDLALRGGDLLVYLLILGATVIFETTLGLFCSLVCRTTFQSMVTTYTAVLVVFGVPMAAQALLLIFAKGMSAAAIGRACFMSPFQAVHSVAPRALGSGGALAEAPLVWPAYVAFALCTAGVLWGYVHTQFERWARRAPRAR